jgi:hypothetical protein
MTDQPPASNPNREGQERTPGAEGEQDRAVVPRSVEGQSAPGRGPEGLTGTFTHPSRRGGNAC